MFSAQAVANYFLDLAKAEGMTLSHMQLQKLVYIAHGWHLAVTGEPLITDVVEAWQFGPVIRSIYQDLKHFGHEPISGRLKDPIFNPATGDFDVAVADFPPDTRDVVDKVWQAYKKFSALQLSAMTHQPDTPWHDVAGGMRASEVKSKYLTISDDAIRTHYLTLAKKGK
jgi:uncharacterized phage-associated protein